MQHLEGSGMPVLYIYIYIYIGRTVLTGSTQLKCTTTAPYCFTVYKEPFQQCLLTLMNAILNFNPAHITFYSYLLEIG
jgi:hypothetical protein